ncbi:MAG: AAA family ATPase [Edaphobacter sp.]
MVNAKLIVISGGPGAGKTTLLEELSRRGAPCVPEIARVLIQEQVRGGGDALPWKDRELYCRLMLERSIASYCEFAETKTVTFFDRGIPDTLCYARLVGLPMEGEIMAACLHCRYRQRVFLAAPWREIYKTDDERWQTYEEAVETYGVMVRAYEDCGYEVVDLPRGTPAERADFISSAMR